jgi:hypothetical protein
MACHWFYFQQMIQKIIQKIVTKKTIEPSNKNKNESFRKFFLATTLKTI